MVAAGMARYADSKALHAAMKLTEEVLFAQPRYGWTVEVELFERGQWLLARTTVREVLQRIVEFYAYRDSVPRERYPDTRTEHSGLARAVLQLGGMGQWRPKARLLRWLGQNLAEAVGPFAAAFLRRLEHDAAAHRAAIAASSNLNNFDIEEKTDALDA
jgi:hypothetical protein